MILQAHNGNRRGTTMVELLVAALIMTTVLGAIGVTVLAGTRSYEEGVARAEVDAQARRLVSRVAEEFLTASAGSCDEGPLLWSGGVEDEGGVEYTYTQVLGAAAGNPLFGTQRRVRLGYAQGELDDGIDNNGNGLVDECRILLTQDTGGGPEIAIGGFVREFLQGEVGANDADDNGNGLDDERGLCITYDEDTNTMMVRLTIERLTSQGRLVTSTAETSVLLRNL
jgi:Tfp pilus assembly protein PilE